MNISIKLNPAVAIASRKAGNCGIGEIVNVTCLATPSGSDIGTIGGVGYRIKEGSGTLTNPNTAAGTATFTASAKAETVKIAAYGLHDPKKELAVASLTIIAPTSLKFTKVGDVIHQQGVADAGFCGKIQLQPAGVSYQRLLIREGEFKGKGSGYYSSENNRTHPAWAAAAPIRNGNEIEPPDDRIYSGHQGQPWSAGKFEWNIPWQFQIIGTNDWTTFAWANHVQEINKAGRVSIGKFNAGPFSANVNDPTHEDDCTHRP